MPTMMQVPEERITGITSLHSDLMQATSICLDNVYAPLYTEPISIVSMGGNVTGMPFASYPFPTPYPYWCSLCERASIGHQDPETGSIRPQDELAPWGFCSTQCLIRYLRKKGTDNCIPLLQEIKEELGRDFLLTEGIDVV